MKLPNFFIVGAPKCGTTALSEYLRAHPQIFMCDPKEPHYFALDLPRYRWVKDWEGYRSLFDSAGNSCFAVGEASVFYLYSDTAILEIQKRFPTARLLIMLRNPVDIAVSMHAQALLSRDECVQSFPRAWALCTERATGLKIPRHCREGKILLYDRIALLGYQLQRLLGIFPREQTRWLFYDDFVNDPRSVYREALSFLGVPDDGRAEFPRVNSRRRAHSQWLAQFTEKTPTPLLSGAMHLKRRLNIKRLGIRDMLRRINFVSAPATGLPPALLAEMRSHFEADIRLLESITGRNLEHWLRETV